MKRVRVKMTINSTGQIYLNTDPEGASHNACSEVHEGMVNVLKAYGALVRKSTLGAPTRPTVDVFERVKTNTPVKITSAGAKEP